jgi:hypothetical protein
MNAVPDEHELPTFNKPPRQSVMGDSSSFATTSTKRQGSRSEHTTDQHSPGAGQNSSHENTLRRDGELLPPSHEPSRERSMSPASDFSERKTTVPPKSLTTFDLGALVLNKMVGTGIFTVPGHVLEATGSKKISIVFWVAGGVYTAMW